MKLGPHTGATTLLERAAAFEQTDLAQILTPPLRSWEFWINAYLLPDRLLTFRTEAVMAITQQVKWDHLGSGPGLQEAHGPCDPPNS